MVWTPALPVENYKYLTAEWVQDTFKYKFDDARKNKYRRFIVSPFVNDEVNSLTSELFANSTIGKDEIPDILSLTYYAGNYDHKSPRECALEMQDTYVRLDKSIAALLDLLDQKSVYIM